MKDLHGRAVVVAGAGAFGLAAALRLADAGADVTVCDPRPPGDNASGVAAGMLAPVFETLLDPGGGDHFEILMAARDLWPAFARRVGLEPALDRSGAVLAALPDEAAGLAAVEGRAAEVGLRLRPLAVTELRRMQPTLSEAVTSGLMSEADWRLEPATVLAALAGALKAAGGHIVQARLEAGEGTFRLEGEAVRGMVVLATGATLGGAAALAPELNLLAPVKGQILHFSGGPLAGPVVRGLGGYVVPQPGGAIVGATMEPGRHDRALDAAVLAALRARAARLFPHLAEAAAVGRAGVRAATPDGLPMVGRSRGAGGAVICAGARRNGWLLAPFVAEAVVQAILGGAPDPRFDPARFDIA